MVAAVVAAIAMAKCFIIDGKILAKFSGNLWLHLLGGVPVSGLALRAAGVRRSQGNGFVMG